METRAADIAGAFAGLATPLLCLLLYGWLLVRARPLVEALLRVSTQPLAKTSWKVHAAIVAVPVLAVLANFVLASAATPGSSADASRPCVCPTSR